jgi:hypothetical protein
LEEKEILFKAKLAPRTGAKEAFELRSFKHKDDKALIRPLGKVNPGAQAESAD